MSCDAELLRRYVKEGSESAFSDLVHTHLNMVYSTALREMYGDRALAEDLSQGVFTELARKAPRLLAHPTLGGWLYTTVRHLAANLRRSEQRRRNREEEAYSMNGLLSQDSPSQNWERIQPVLDDALHELKTADREALVLRFLEDRSLREVGESLGLNENSARMRVDRALEKLRALLSRRGITSTASGLAAALAFGVLTPAPSTFAAAVVSTALASGVAVSSTALTLIKAMSITKTSLVSALVVVSIAVPAWQQTRLQRVQAQNEQLQAQITQSSAKKEALGRVRDQSKDSRGTEVDAAELERLRKWQAQVEPELLRLRGMAGVARRAIADAEQLRAQLARQNANGDTNLISGAMSEAMKLGFQQQVEGRLSRMTASLHLTPEQVQAVKTILGRQAEMLSAGMQQAFSGKYDKEELTRLGKEMGDPELQIKSLLTPEQQSNYPAYQREEAAYTARTAANSDLFRLQNTLELTPEQGDRAFAALYELNFNQLTGVAKPVGNHLSGMAYSQAEILQWSLDQKAKALEPVLTPSQMETYRQQLATESKLATDILRKMGVAGDSK